MVVFLAVKVSTGLIKDCSTVEHQSPVDWYTCTVKVRVEETRRFSS